ncbi:MAG: hypothetical protein ACOQNV_00900 [Mycoplasmoidaceae bacterium]
MKRKLILLPITLTALTPAISMVGCSNPDEPTSTKHIVTFSAGEHGSLEGETTITVEGNETTLGEITKPTVIADEEHEWFFEGWDCDDSLIIKQDLTVEAKYFNISECMIDLDEIETIISLEGVQYAQSENKITAIIGGYVDEAYDNCEFSPTVYHDEIYDSIFEEMYVYPVDTTTYKKQYRASKDDPWQVVDASPNDFFTPNLKLGNDFLSFYNRLKNNGGSLSFNTEKKCYEGSWVEAISGAIDIEFYFRRNKLIGFGIHAITEFLYSYEHTEVITITYDEYTPDLPIPPTN